MAKSEDLEQSQKDLFADLVRHLLLAEIRVMIRRLQDTGKFQLPEGLRFEDLDPEGLKYLKTQLRDTLRSLGGGR